MKDETRQLLEWYDNNRRILPWREDPTPYHVWLSEIMLQQTRVEAVKGYYDRFTRTLPDIEALANADEDTYLKLWQGLGYYNRVRNLHKAAVQIMEEHNGKMPRTAAELKMLAGIGDYTSAAIASIAFGEPVPAIDGNLLRVWARRTLYKGNIKDGKAKKAAAPYYQGRIPDERPGDYNQALMDLGATVCIPHGAPHCDTCPWQKCCKAHASGVELDYPVSVSKIKRAIDQYTVFLLHDSSGVVLRRRPDEGLLAGLYEYPNINKKLKAQEAIDYVESLGFTIRQIAGTIRAKHIFSHREWHMTGYDIEVEDIHAGQKELIPATYDELREKYSVPSAFAKFTETLLSEGGV